MPNFKKNTSPFQMKRSPTKNLAEFFRGLGKEGTEARQEKQRAKNKGEYEGMTDFEKRRAEKKSRKAGESKFQADTRRKREAKIVEPAVVEEPKSKAYVPQEFKGEAGDKFRYRKMGGTQEFGKHGGGFSMFEFMDPDRPELKWIPAQGVDGDYAGFNAIQDLYGKRQKAGELFDSPMDKKSPYKKGIGKYAKKPKGSRGYKMKRK